MAPGESASVWVALSRDSSTIANLLAASGPEAPWRSLRPRTGFAGWTDDYASILPLLNLRMLVPLDEWR
jgi:hypothetical protein